MILLHRRWQWLPATPDFSAHWAPETVPTQTTLYPIPIVLDDQGSAPAQALAGVQQPLVMVDSALPRWSC